MSADVLPVRRVSFEYPDDMPALWSSRDPEFAAACNAVSLGMPYAEPLFIKAVRSTYPDLDDDLRARTETYTKQEIGHYTQHKRLNGIVARDFPSTVALQRWMERCTDWVWRRSHRFSVAYAAAGETISFGVARWASRHLDLMDRAEPVAATLFLWHLAEEIEHKASTYDVFEATDGSRLRYALAMIVAFTQITTFIAIGTIQQLWGARRLRYPITWWRLLKLAVSFAFVVIPCLVLSALPRHHPSQFRDPEYLPAWLDLYDEETGTMPLWGTPAADPLATENENVF